MMEQRRVQVEVRAAERGGQKQLAGYAAKYNVRSHVIGGKFREVIERGAFDRALGQHQDTVATINHDPNFVLGRTGSGTLRLRTDSVGLGYELDLGNQSYARDLYESVKRGDIGGCSFAFNLQKGVDDEWDYDEDSMALRSIRNFRELADISFVTNPAYPETTVDARGLELMAAAEVRSRSGAKARPWRQVPVWRRNCESRGLNPDTCSYLDLIAAIQRSMTPLEWECLSAGRPFNPEELRSQMDDLINMRRGKPTNLETRQRRDREMIGFLLS